jgi:predicted PurR-regulated permease PerM
MSIPPPTERQARIIWLALTGLAMAVFAALVMALVWGLGKVVQVLSPVLWPLAVAGVLAYLLDPVVDFLERKGTPRPRAILAVFAGALLLLAALFGSVVPHLINETRQLASQIPAYANRALESFDEWIDHPPPWARRLLEREQGARAARAKALTPLATTNHASPAGSTNAPGAVGSAPTNVPAPLLGRLGRQELHTAAGWLAQALGSVGPWLWSQAWRVASWFGVLVGLALVPVYAFYFLLEKQRISSSWTDYLPVADSRFKQELVFVLSSINNYLIAFFRGQVPVAICNGTLYGIGFLAIGLPYAVLLGALAVVLTMVPFLGAIMTCCTALIIALARFGDWLHPLLVLAVFGVVQALEALVISPKIMSGRVGLHPVTIIIAVMAGTTLLGNLLGGILAIPLAAALRVAMSRYVWKKPPAGEAAAAAKGAQGEVAGQT